VSASTARSALTAMGFRSREVRAAIETARSHVGDQPTTESLIRAALRALHRGAG